MSMRTESFLTAVMALLLWSPTVCASAFVRGAYYKLGDADPGASAGNVGNDPTIDSFAELLNLSRRGQPTYSADVSSLSIDSKLSMRFTNDPAGAGGGSPLPAAAYSRSTSLDMSQQGFGLETWVKIEPNSDASGYGLIAYNGNPASDGFGFFRHGGTYVLRIGSFEKPLGAAPAGQWHHLAFLHEFTSNRYYYDGKLIEQSTTDPTPLTASTGFALGADVTGAEHDLFNGWIDEVRYFTYNPLAAGAFNPESFLIAPEPGSAAMLALAVFGCLGRRGRAKGRRDG